MFHNLQQAAACRLKGHKALPLLHWLGHLNSQGAKPFLPLFHFTHKLGALTLLQNSSSFSRV